MTWDFAKATYSAALTLPAVSSLSWAAWTGISANRNEPRPWLWLLPFYLGLTALCSLSVEAAYWIQGYQEPYYVYLLTPLQSVATFAALWSLSQSRWLLYFLIANGLFALPALQTYRGDLDSPYLHLQNLVMLMGSLFFLIEASKQRRIPMTQDPGAWIAAATLLDMALSFLPFLFTNWINHQSHRTIMAVYLIRSLCSAGANLLYVRAFKCLAHL